MFVKRKKIRLYGGVLLKILVYVSTFYFLYQSLFNDEIKPEIWFSELMHLVRHTAGIYVLAALILIFFNWGLEAKKWQKLAVKVEPISFWQAYRAVLVGICLGFITPNRIGDYAGRIMALQSRQRLDAVGAIFLGRFCQLFITVAMGSVSLFYFLYNFLNLPGAVLLGLASSLIIVNAFLFLLFFQPGIMVTAATALPFAKTLIRYITVISTYSASELSVVLQLSLWRYGIFLSQFMLLLYAFGIHLSWWQLALGVSSTFLLKSVVPSISALSDLGMRELSAMFFFSLLNQNKLLVMSASLSLWFINIALPSLVGLIFVWQLKIKSSRIKQKNKFISVS